MTTPRSRLLDPSILTYLVGVPTIIVAGVVAARQSQEVGLPSPATLLVVFASLLVFLVCAGESFASLFHRELRGRARSSFYVSQLVKYIPGGGLAQFASQASQMKLDGRNGLVTVARSKVIGAVAGLLWGPILALTVDSLDTWLRVLLAGGALGVVLLWPPLLTSVAARIEPDVSEHVSDADLSTTLRSLAWALVSTGAAGIGFSLAVGMTPAELSTWSIVSAYGVAWTIGYLAVPIPGGIGVREGALTFLLPLSAGSVLVAAVVVRLLQIAGELLLALVVSPVLVRRARSGV